MKLLTTLLFCCVGILGLGQGSLNYQLTILNTKGHPVRGADIVLIETKTLQRKAFKTGPDGKVNISLNSGKEWGISVKDMRNCQYVDVPEHARSTGSATITYGHRKLQT